MLYSSTSSFAATHSTEEDAEETHPEIALSPVSPLPPTQGNTGNDILVAPLGINFILYGTHKHKSTHTATGQGGPGTSTTQVAVSDPFCNAGNGAGGIVLH